MLITRMHVICMCAEEDVKHGVSVKIARAITNFFRMEPPHIFSEVNYYSIQLSCKLCTKAVKFALPRIKKRGCSFLFKLQAIAGMSCDCC